MEINITNMEILIPFFENPDKEFYIRELSRILKINHTTIRQKLNKLVKQGFLSVKKTNLTTSYSIILSQKYLNLKLYYNLEKIRSSGIIEDLDKKYDFPIVVLFGSYAQARDQKESDIDLCLITDLNKEIETSKYEKVLNRKISIHKFTKKTWENAIIKNPELINNICNGIVLAGQLEILK